ncbi:MAG TPA: PEGA domain-containing protein [Patescibacteria group bacterium]|jgi:hypothetical protein|nr:PEGA domain-containing protein [Patescibacteria group bacterium]
MKKTSRYLLIGLGMLIFFVLAPALILYVSGTRVNIDGRDTNSTGILDVKSSPSGSTVYVNDANKGSTPATIRFLNQGEYLVKIVRDGYYDWSKRLPVEAGQVEFAQEGVAAVQLIKKSDPLVIEPKNVSSFLLINNVAWYMQGNDLVAAPLTNTSTKTVIQNITNTPSGLSMLRDKKHILIPGKQPVLIDTTNNAVTTLPFEVKSDSQLQLPSPDVALFNDNNRVYYYNLIAKNTVAVKSGVRAFTMLGNTAYFAREDGVISSAVWNGTDFTDEQTISENLTFDKAEISLIISDRKELFLDNAGSGFYRVGPTLDKVMPRVDVAQLDPTTNELTLQVSGELWFYNFLTNKPQLLTRSTSQGSSFFIRSNIGYGFVGTATGLEAVEIDSRDKQNRYQLLKDKQVYEIAMTEDEKTVLALQDGALVMLQIRD